MPRLTQKLPSYRKHRASGQAVVTLGGTDHYLGRHGSKASRLLYDRLVAEWLASGRTAQVAPDAKITVVELSARYLKFAKGYYKKNGRCTRVTPAIKITIGYLKDWYGREAAEDFGPVALKALRERLVEEGHNWVTASTSVDPAALNRQATGVKATRPAGCHRLGVFGLLGLSN